MPFLINIIDLLFIVIEIERTFQYKQMVIFYVLDGSLENFGHRYIFAICLISNGESQTTLIDVVNNGAGLFVFKNKSSVYRTI